MMLSILYIYIFDVVRKIILLFMLSRYDGIYYITYTKIIYYVIPKYIIPIIYPNYLYYNMINPRLFAKASH